VNHGLGAVLAVAAALGGCSNVDTSAWFSKPLDMFGRKGGYTYSALDSSTDLRPVTANDFMDANGACPHASPSPQPAPASAPEGDGGAALGGGVAIGMTECEVVARAGQPSAVNLGRNPNGDRTAIVTYNGGPRPGIYRFIGGRLAEMDRVEEQTPPPEASKKKPSKVKTKQAKTDGNG
jgi:hypothetical protein